jgi:hypothetical protein
MHPMEKSTPIPGDLITGKAIFIKARKIPKIAPIQ